MDLLTIASIGLIVSIFGHAIATDLHMKETRRQFDILAFISLGLWVLSWWVD